MKILKHILVFGAAMILLSSCYKEDYFLDDNTTSDGKHFPIVQSVEVSNEPNSGFVEGNTVELTVHYWSEDPILQYELYETVGAGSETLYSTTPYQFTYDEEAQSEVVTLTYEVPAGSSGQSIVLNVVLVNENGLTKSKSATVDIM